MKIKIVPTPEPTYPQLKRDNRDNDVGLFTSETKGVILHSGILGRIGQSIEIHDLDKKSWVYFEGHITLSNV